MEELPVMWSVAPEYIIHGFEFEPGMEVVGYVTFWASDEEVT